ncbi:MAG TPA: M23 family metallopeptidase [Jatrophihabitantaceae bacterium]
MGVVKGTWAGRPAGLRQRLWALVGALALAFASSGSSAARAVGGSSAARAVGESTAARAVGESTAARAVGGSSAAARAVGESTAARAVGGSAAARPAALLASAPRESVSGQPPPGETTSAAYAAPIAGPIHVLRPFEPPPTPYAAGHRGADLAAPPGGLVLAAASGRVTFAGPVAGRGVVVIAHPDGIRTEYEPVAPLVASGQTVARGQPIARLRGQHDKWPPGQCLHWGARRGDTYIDPMLLLRPLGPVRLLPWP